MSSDILFVQDKSFPNCAFMQMRWEHSTTYNMATPKTLIILLLLLGVISACPDGKSSFHCIRSLYFSSPSWMFYAFACVICLKQAFSFLFVSTFVWKRMKLQWRRLNKAKTIRIVFSCNERVSYFQQKKGVQYFQSGRFSSHRTNCCLS